MGTSGRSDGPNPGTPLVPSWLDDAPAGPPPAAPPEAPPGGEPPPIPHLPGSPPGPLPPMPPAPPPDVITCGPALAAAATQLAAWGHRGLQRAASFGVLRDFQRDGVNATLRRLNLGDLVGRPLEEVFTGLTDVVCRDGGSIDKGIALDAWLETVADLEEFNVSDPAALTPEQMRDIFLSSIAHTIEGRLLQDVGANGLKVAPDLAAIEAFERQLRDYIRRSVRDSFASDITTPASLTDRQIQEIVDRTYIDRLSPAPLHGQVRRNRAALRRFRCHPCGGEPVIKESVP